VLAKSDIARASGGPLALLRNLYGNLAGRSSGHICSAGLLVPPTCDRRSAARAAPSRDVGLMIVRQIAV